MALALDTDGALWVGTFGGGLARLNKDRGVTDQREGDAVGGRVGIEVEMALAPGADGAL